MKYFAAISFNNPPFVSFLIASIAIHFTLLILIPVKDFSRYHVQPEIFDVELVMPRPLAEKKSNPKSAGPASSPKKITKDKSRQSKIKNSAHEKIDYTENKEATVSLYADNNKFAPYLLHVRSKIDSEWEYPASAKERGIGGKLTLCFSIDQNGSLLDVNLLEPSRHSSLNREAVQAIKQAAPFNPFPISFSISKLNVQGAFIYQFSR